MQLLRKLLFPISLVYALVVFLRNKLYDVHILRASTFGTKIICIGNLSVGGTGKTPMTELLIRSLAPSRKVAVLSRGYKRRSKGFVLATDQTTVADIGDEPYQLFTKFPEITVAVDADRRNGIRRLEQEVKPKVILLDDAFQHRKVKPDYAILLTTYGKLYSEDWYLPTGDLRDAKYAADRADCIVVTKCPQELSAERQRSLSHSLKVKPHQQLLFAYLSYGNCLHQQDAAVPIERFVGKSVTLVTGIANPAPLVSFLEGKGIVLEHLAYRDHHFFSESELQLFRSKEYIITTEKDYTRLKDHLDNVYYVTVSHRFMGTGQTVLENDLNQLMNC